MLTRRILAGLAGASLAAPALRSARAAARKIKLGVTLPPDSNVGDALRHLMQEVASGTQGRAEIEVMWSGTAGGEIDMMQGVAKSTLDAALIAVSPLGEFVPEMALLDMPFIFRDKAHALSVVDGPIGTEMAAKLASHHITILGWSENGIRHLSANRAVMNVGDLAGLKIRVAGNDVVIKAFKAMGADAGTVAWNRLYDEIKAGRFEAEENSISNIIAGHLQEVQKFIMLTTHSYSASVIIASDDVMDDLSPADRDTLVRAAQEAGRMTRTETESRGINGLKALREQGITVIDNVDRESFIKALAPSVATISAAYGTAAMERIRAYST